MLLDTETERHFARILFSLRAELAAPGCSGDCANCPLANEKTATHGAVSNVSDLTIAEVGQVTWL